MGKKHEIRIRPVVRYIVSEYHEYVSERGGECGGSRSLGEFESISQAEEVATVFAAHLGAPIVRDDNGADAQPTLRTVGELMEALATLDPSRTPMSLEPPFDGVRVIAQRDSDRVLIAPPPRKPQRLLAKGEAADAP